MSNKLIRKLIQVTGIVQGVGFRPFVYNLASQYSLKGWVNNTSQGVYIDVEGEEEKLKEFIVQLKTNSPPLARVENITYDKKAVKGYQAFRIKTSSTTSQNSTLIAPDVSICEECKEELKDPKDRRYYYPFINCTNCGPRFSIIKDLPYDRSSTTMNSFIMCDKCKEEYENPRTRRFHAQPNACADCGPIVWLTDNQGKQLKVKAPIKKAVELLKEGKILAVKGLGGFHLVCDATQGEVVDRLRARKGRPAKPLAVMMKDITKVKKYCDVRTEEVELLESIKKPIVLVTKKGKLPINIAPDTNQLGVMLPYTPLHYLLFAEGLEVLIATSANRSSLPIEYKNQRVRERLAEVVDYFLVHDRKIKVAVDDSVVQFGLGRERVIRRSRGYAPQPVRVEKIAETLACGADFKNVFCLSQGEFAFLSQHNGDLDNLETKQRFKENIAHLQQIYDIQPQIIAHDLHPDYYSTRFAQAIPGKKVGVQHHHAHLVSCMVEQKIKAPVIGLAFDGTGYGTDGKIWGGEFLICDYSSFDRVGHLNYVQLPGGDKAVEEPWRMAVSYLFKTGFQLDVKELLSLESSNYEMLIQMLQQGINCPATSSLGRLFAGVSALLGLCKKRNYRPQAAVKLERIASEVERSSCYLYQINQQEGKYIINTDEIMLGIVEDIYNQLPKSIIARKFHNTVVSFSSELCKLIRNKYGLNRVVLSGGVFQNRIIRAGIYNSLLEADFKVYLPERIPCNDGGLAIGQLVIANYQERSKY